MDDFAPWLKREIDRQYPTQAAFARAVGVRPQVVSQWVSGKDIPRLPNLMAIGRALRKDYRLVARRAGYAVPDEPPPRSVDDILEELRAHTPLPVPIVQNVVASMGPGRPADEYLYLPPAFRRGRRTNILGVVAQGTSMEPEIRAGDYVIFDGDAAAQVNDLVVAVVEGEVYVKRLVRERGTVALRGDADGRTIPLTDQAQIVGRVIFITRPK